MRISQSFELRCKKEKGRRKNRKFPERYAYNARKQSLIWFKMSDEISAESIHKESMENCYQS